MLKSMRDYQDAYYDLKQKTRMNPKPKALAYNLVENAQLVLFDQEMIKQFYLQQDKYIKQPSILYLLQPLMSNGVLLSEGSVWKRHRKLTSSAFNFDYLKEIFPKIVEIAEELLERLKSQIGYSIHFLNAVQRITGEVVARLFFGEKFIDRRFKGFLVADYLATLLARCMIEQSSLLSFLFSSRIVFLKLIPRHKQLFDDIRDFREFILEIIKKRFSEISESEKSDQMSLIDLFYKQGQQDLKEGFTMEEIVDEFITFFVAGMDTTGHLITMMSYYYLKMSPNCQEKLLKEADETFKDPSKVTLEGINKMDYMSGMIKESLRMATPTPTLFMRKAIKDHKLGDLMVKRGTIVNVGIIANNFDPDLHEDPDVFKVERWIEEGSRTRKSIGEFPYAFIPFSAGVRNCLGQHLAISEAKVIFGLFLKKFKYKINERYELSMVKRFLYEPEDPLYYVLSKREE